MHKGGPLGPNISFFTSSIKTRKDFSPSFFFFFFFFCNCLNISYASFGEKKNDNCSQILFQNVNVFIFSYFELNFIQSSFGKVFFFFFFKFWSRDYFRETKIRFLAATLKRNISLMFFLLIYGCLRCIQIWWQVSYRNSCGKVGYLKMVGSKWTPLVHKRE